ncbi:permease [Alloscardovia macacae]|uniref:Probable membrane transporter protein n=1 Tax=Alloscardovia macacae TaxID=1160091 RepID=A0A1Y2T2J6_9BIFI|nr:sulfite exporter TauE/SafE family protein [Alloscardovia macacae]OTA26950.1 permease [Alloscardovia macacae]OTA30062.1 permease [Alloscardovia macacae]
MTSSLLLALIIGLGVGLVVGALGAGGGILSVPVLVYILGMEPHAASAGSLVIVGLTALVSLIPRSREGFVRWKDGVVFGALSTVGTFAGSRLSGWLDARVLMLLFSALLAVVGVVMLIKALRPTEVSHAPEQRSIMKLLLCATATGFLTGFFGVGGGFAVVPMLVLALGFSIREASSTSLLVMIIASSVGLLSRIGSPVSVDWLTVLIFAAASMAGGLVGAPLSRRAKASTLTLIFGVLLLAVAGFALVQTLWF